MRARLAALAAATLALSACAGGEPDLRRPASGEGPDEFAIVTHAPLEAPDDLSALPPPTPGAPNRADATPLADAAAALGGRRAAARGAGEAGGVPASDAALVRHAGRAGLTEDIRATLAEEDARFRRNRGRLGVFIRGDRYLRAYAGQAIDPWQQIERFRAAGARVPSAPPAD